MVKIRDIVFKYFKESEKIVVFPSEDSARYFLMEYVKSEKKAIKAERAIAFDTFRALFLPQHDDESPTNSYHRALFTSTLDLKGLNLTYLSSNEYAEAQPRLRPFIEKCLPLLEERDKYKAELKADLDKLYIAYTEFLSANKLFETSYETLSKTELDKEYVVLFPELTAGADEVVEFLKDEKKVKFLFVKELELEIKPKLFKYANTKLEIKELMRTLVTLREQEVRISDITISTPDLTAIKPLLKAEANLYSIPLNFNVGDPILNTVPGMLLSKLQKVYQTSFSFSSLEDLLLSPTFPWLDLSFNRQFIINLANKGAKSGSTEYKMGGDAIYTSLSRFNPDDDVSKKFFEYYKELKSTIISLFSAKTMDVVQLTLHSFMATFFTEEQFYDGGERENEYSFLLNEMNNFARVQKSLNLESTAVLNLLLTSLKSKLYVSQNKVDGIKVYNFGQDVLIDTPYHFVIGLCDDLTKTVGQKAVYFEPYEVVVEEKQKNVSDEYFTLYELGSEYLRFSYAEDTYSGVVIPSQYFLIKGEILDAPITTDSYKEALKVVKGNSSDAHSLPLLKECFEQGKETALSHLNYTDDWANLNVTGAKSGRMKFSFSSLDTYMGCPYAYYIRYMLSLTDETFYPQDIDHALVGEKLHGVVEAFFKKWPTLEGNKVTFYKEEIAKLFKEMIEKWKKESKAPSSYTIYWMMERYLPSLQTMIENTIVDFPSSSTLALEEKIKGSVEDLEFTGFIDRVVSLSDGTIALIDYKKGSGDSKKDTFQLPLYKLFYEEMHKGKEVSTLAYYGFGDDKAVEVLDVGIKTREAIKAIYALEEGLKNGKWSAKPDKDVCSDCTYRSICRRRFTII